MQFQLLDSQYDRTNQVSDQPNLASLDQAELKRPLRAMESEARARSPR